MTLNRTLRNVSKKEREWLLRESEFMAEIAWLKSRANAARREAIRWKVKWEVCRERVRKMKGPR